MAKSGFETALGGRGPLIDGSRRKGRSVREFLQLSTAEQERLLDRLSHHALFKMKRLTWRGARIALGGSVPRGCEPYDVAMEALSDALEDGGSRWNRQVNLTLESYLRAVIDSKISNLVNLAENKLDRRLESSVDSDNPSGAFTLVGREQDAAHFVIELDTHSIFRDRAIAELEGEESLIRLFECLDSGYTAPAEIAELLSTESQPITAEDIYNLMKRLRRKLDKLKPAKKGKSS